MEAKTKHTRNWNWETEAAFVLPHRFHAVRCTLFSIFRNSIRLQAFHALDAQWPDTGVWWKRRTKANVKIKTSEIHSRAKHTVTKNRNSENWSSGCFLVCQPCFQVCQTCFQAFFQVRQTCFQHFFKLVKPAFKLVFKFVKPAVKLVFKSFYNFHQEPRLFRNKTLRYN